MLPTKLEVARWINAHRPSAFDVFFVLVAVLLGVHSFALPFGDDQGLYYYVAREWRHGSIPYRDVFDHKPPGIYVVYRISMTLFGEHLSSSRILDLGCVLALGVIVARLLTPAGDKVARGLTGMACTIASLSHYGFFDFWTTGQTELWFTTLGIAAVTTAVRMRSLRRATAVTGVLTGLAFLMKPPSVTYTLIAALVLLRRVLREPDFASAEPPRTRPAKARALGRASLSYAAGALAPFALTLLYFWSQDGLGAFFDIVVRGNGHYARTFKNATTIASIASCHLDALTSLSVLGYAAIVALVVGFATAIRTKSKRILERSVIGASLLAAACAAVTMQQKFFGVHWVTLVGPMTFILAALADELRMRIASDTQVVRQVASVVVPVGAILIGYRATPRQDRVLSREQDFVIDYVTGKRTREEFARNFYSPPMNYYQVDIDAVSAFLNEHAHPSDTICVRGFSPQIYAQTGLRYGGRFFWTNFIYHPLSYRRADFIREDRDALVQTRPRFMVTVKNQEGGHGIDAAETYYPLGYRLSREFGSLQVLERTDDLQAE